MTVLIVDDSPLIIQKINELLADVLNIGHITGCGTHHEAVKLMDELMPAVAILDINLPDKSGMEVLSYIKRNHPKTIVIMCTNQHSSYYREECLKLGANFFIDKSKDFEKIPQLISSLHTSAK
jgi:DNA-binding NarL/FixJ family response regulator